MNYSELVDRNEAALSKMIKNLSSEEKKELIKLSDKIMQCLKNTKNADIAIMALSTCIVAIYSALEE